MLPPQPQGTQGEGGRGAGTEESHSLQLVSTPMLRGVLASEVPMGVTRGGQE